MDTLDAGHRQRCACPRGPPPLSLDAPVHVLTPRCSIGLPSINHLDSDRVKREEADYHRKQSTAAMATPLHPFAGPPHLHSNHQSSVASAVPASLGGLLSPPESRRTSGDEKESQRPTARQSLPSIHEALGSEQPLSYPAPVPPPSAPVSAPQHYHPSSAVTSPSDPRQRTFSTDLHGSQGPSNPFSHPRSPYIGTPASHAPPPPPPQSHAESSHRPLFSSPRPPFSSNPQHNSKLPTLHPLKTTQSPPTSAARPNAPYSYPPHSASYEASAPPPPGSMSHYAYPPYSSNYPLTAPPQSAPNSAYPPATSTYSAPPRYPPPGSWRDGSEMARLEEKKIGRSSLAPYGESVKRHLESFDLEASLNEVRTRLAFVR
jgi:glutamate--cysteine ligase catalytic subunit